MNARFVALVAGVFFFFLAVATQGILPFVEPSARTNRVTAPQPTIATPMRPPITIASVNPC